MFWVVLGICIGLILTGYEVRQNSENMCEEKCEDLNALTQKVILSGDWFKSNDVCVCVFKDRIKAFKLGDGK